MSELSEAARALIRDGQSVLRPSLDDRARVASALAARLGETAVVASTAAVGSAAGRWLPWQKVAGVVAAGGLLGLGASWALLEPEAPRELPVASRPVRSLNAVSTPVSPPAPADETAPTPLASPPTQGFVSSAKPMAASDRLAEEVAILSKATSELRGGRAGAALRLLDDHQRRFPGGRLVEERRAARIQALCALGSRAAAESELARLARSSPRSPHLARAQQACGFSKPGG